MVVNFSNNFHFQKATFPPDRVSNLKRKVPISVSVQQMNADKPYCCWICSEL